MHSANIAWDRVHPNQAGHMAIARAWLDAVGYEWGAK
jgi:lysophospholipase L1-like esterase